MGFPLRRVLHIHLAIRTLGGEKNRVQRDKTERSRQGDGREDNTEDEEGLERTWTVGLDGAGTLV